MGIYAKDTGGGDFTPAPEGQWQGVCVDVIDLGMVERTYNNEKKLRHEVRIAFQLFGKTEDGKDIRTDSNTRFSVGKLFGLNLSEKGSLRPFLESWRGRKFTSEETDTGDGFDIEKLIGANALLQIVHNKVGDKTYANIQSIMPWNAQWGAKIEAENYVRKAERDKQPAAEASAPRAVAAPTPQTPKPHPSQWAKPVEGDDIPF